jgi:hypothetical protein
MRLIVRCAEMELLRCAGLLLRLSRGVNAGLRHYAGFHGGNLPVLGLRHYAGFLGGSVDLFFEGGFFLVSPQNAALSPFE